MRMILGERTVPSRTRPLRVTLLQCDNCLIKFERNWGSGQNSRVEHFCSRKCSQEKHQQIRLDVAATPEVRKKAKLTTQKRFGVESVLSIPAIHSLCNTHEKCQQRHETMKKNGSYNKSRAEDRFYDWLCQVFGHEDIERQKIVGHWPIDFYIKSTNTYVQFDGEYWHGLDRSLEEIKKLNAPRDATILKKMETDSRQSEWFANHELFLVRITDKQFERGELPNAFKQKQRHLSKRQY